MNRQAMAFGFGFFCSWLSFPAHAQQAASPASDGPSPSPAPDVTAQANASAEAEPQDVVALTVDRISRVTKIRRSANAVSVVNLDKAKQRSSDLGDVLARSTAVTVQRAGGLGSRGAFSLGGLGGARLRFFLDGVPLDLMGYVAGVQNVPVNLIKRIEVYQGVVPARFGADALGGAVHLVTDDYVWSNRLAAAYQIGSFGTQRLSLSGQAHHEPTGIYAQGAAFLDLADNDYRVDVSTFDELGRPQSVRARRFHDGYRGVGGQLGVGVIGKTWADRLVLSGFYSNFVNDVQNGATMVRPYGEVEFGRNTHGLNLRYRITRDDTEVSAVAGYARLDSRFRDLSKCLYNWLGDCTPRSLSGEISGTAQSIDQTTDTFFFRGQLQQKLTQDHAVRLVVAPTYVERTGKNRLRVAGNDPLAPLRQLFKGVVSVELESGFGLNQLRNIAFVKGYALSSTSSALLATGDWQDMSRDLMRVGGGDSLRWQLVPGVYSKASYEFAMRQPSTNELFGDGMLVLDNLALRPETSHNVNLGFHVEGYDTGFGTVRGSVEGFARWSDDMVALIAEADYLRNVNLWEARALGVDTAVGWTAPGSDWLAVDGHLTYQDVRNTSDSGPFAQQAGDRVPSLPYLSANGSTRLRAHDVITALDKFELSWNVRYVHSFLRSWESLATNAQRLEIAAQLSHGIALTHTMRSDQFTLHTTVEAQNITNEKLFDFYGVQRPGRAFFGKASFDL